MREVQYNDGHHVCRHSSVADCMYIVVEGCLKVWTKVKGSKMSDVTICHAGACVGEGNFKAQGMASWPGDVFAVGATKVLGLRRAPPKPECTL